METPTIKLSVEDATANSPFKNLNPIPINHCGKIDQMGHIRCCDSAGFEKYHLIQ
jgi:hypothetical protein